MAVRHPKLIRDSIAGITKPAIGRLCQTAGIKRISHFIYAELRGVMKSFMEIILKAAITFTENDRRKTVQQSDLDGALESRGIYLGAGVSSTTNNTFTTKKARQRSSKSSTEPSETKKAHRFKPGTVALQEIRYQQKHSDNFSIPKANFQRLTREISQDWMTSPRFSHNFMELFQLVVESYLIKILEDANLCCIHAGRQTVQVQDIILATRIIKNHM